MADYRCPHCNSGELEVSIAFGADGQILRERSHIKCKQCGRMANLDTLLGDSPRQTAGPSAGSGSNCFIATAACGTSQTADVIRLQQFRESVLRRTGSGRALISVYETLSPPLARLIARWRLTRLLIRTMVVRPAGWLVDRVGLS